MKYKHKEVERMILYLIKYDKKTSEGLVEHMRKVLNKRVQVNNVHIVNRCTHKYHDRGIVTSHRFDSEHFKLPIGTHRYYLLNSEQPSVGDYVMTSHYKTPNKRGFVTELDKSNGMCVIDNEYIINTSEVIYIVTNPELMTKEYERI